MALPKAAGQELLSVVPKYKHVGSVVSANADHDADTLHRSSMASAVLAPLSKKVMSSPQIELPLRESFGTSLVLSCLLHLVHLWSKLQAASCHWVAGH